VSAFPCSIHGQKVRGRLATLYNRWPNLDGTWSRWKQRLCVDCATALLVPLKAGMSAESLDRSVCPVCGKDSSADQSPIFLSVYLPKQEPREYALTTCVSCATSLQGSLRDGAIPLPDRGGFDSGARAPELEDWSEV